MVVKMLKSKSKSKSYPITYYLLINPNNYCIYYIYIYIVLPREFFPYTLYSQYSK